MIEHKITRAMVRATGPSLDAILTKLGWELREVTAVQLSRRGSDVPFLVRYERVGDGPGFDD